MRLSLAHDDFDGIVSCALAGCPRPRRPADYPDLPRLLEGYRGELYATEVNDLGLYQRLPRVHFYDHHDSVHRVLGVEPGVPVEAVWDGEKWSLLRAGRATAASMVSGLRQLGYSVPDDLARAGDLLDNFALAETERDWRIVAGYLLSVRDAAWKRRILDAASPEEAVEAARAAIAVFEARGREVPWGRVEELKREAVGRQVVEGAPVVVVAEAEEGLGRLAMLQLERRYPYVALLRIRADGTVRGTIVSLTRRDAHLAARRLGGGGRPLWPSGSIGGFHAPSLEEALEGLRRALHGG